MFISPFLSVFFMVLMRDDFSLPLIEFCLVAAFSIAYYISSIIHELAHYSFFKHYKLPIVELSFGIFRFMFSGNRIIPVLTLDRPFEFLCSCKGLREISNRKRSVCLLAGGAANFVVAVILAVLYLNVPTQRIKLLFLIQIIACITNVCINIVNPYSTDRKLLRKLNRQTDSLERRHSV